MSKSEHRSTTSDAFHVAKLALFNVRLLGDLQQASRNNGEVAATIKARAQLDHVSMPVSLLHQSTFMQLGYICLVWLWEVSKAEKCSDSVLSHAAKNFDFSGAIRSKVGERLVNSPASVVRLVRNAISHARVSADDEYFTFSDKGRDEQAATSVRLSWPEFALLSEAILFAVNALIYPSTDRANV